MRNWVWAMAVVLASSAAAKRASPAGFMIFSFSGLGGILAMRGFAAGARLEQSKASGQRGGGRRRDDAARAAGGDLAPEMAGDAASLARGLQRRARLTADLAGMRTARVETA